MKNHRTLAATFVLLLIGGLSLPSLELIPYNSEHFFYGFDFFNLYTYHHCSLRDNVYEIIVDVCGDERGMIYPPWMYYAFLWTRSMSLAAATQIWTLSIFAFTILTFILFLPAPLIESAHSETSRDMQTSRLTFLPWTFLLTPLFFIQFAPFFALERGNNDALVLFVWSLAFVFFQRRYYKTAIFIMAFTSLLKVYPLVAAFLVFASLYFANTQHRLRWKDYKEFLLSHWRGKVNYGWIFIASCVVLSIPLFSDHWFYFTKIFPRWARELYRPEIFSHSIQSLAKAVGLPGGLFLLAGLYVFITLARKFAQRRLDVLFASAIAFASFAPGVAYDYSLILCLPLFFVLFCDAIRLERARENKMAEFYFLFFVLGIEFVLGFRHLWKNDLWNLEGWHLIPQFLWFYGVLGLYAGSLRPEQVLSKNSAQT